jgi:F420-dependent oxidoreductase-like protein
MKIGIGVTNFSWPGPDSEIGPRVARIARQADEAGFDSLWTMDHFFQIRVMALPPEAPMLEAYATLAFMAAHTRRISLGTLVTCVAYRHPGVLIKTVTSLDVLTGGRMVLGVGAGFAGYPPGMPVPAVAPANEVEGLGIPFPSLAERFERLEELLQIAHQMWRGDEEPFQGRHYQLGRPINSPNSLQRPHPPILVAGGGERKTLRLVAKYADACNLFDIPGRSEELSRKLEVLRAHCREVGRDYAEIEKTTGTQVDLAGDPDGGARRLVDHLGELAELGIDHALVMPTAPQPWDDKTLEAVASVVPEVHAISTARAA